MNKTIIFAIFATFFISCDPIFEESMWVQNESGKDLEIVIKAKNHKYYYTSELVRNNPNILFKFPQTTDTLIVMLATIPNDSGIYFIRDGGTGYINFEDSGSALTYIKNAFDTIYVESPILTKDLYNFDLWSQIIKFERHSSQALFKFYIARGDVR